MSTNVIASYNTSTPSETAPHSEKLKAHVEHILGRDNIMFDCQIELFNNKNTGRIVYHYHNTCKLCGHVTKRKQRTKLIFVCGGCYREWDRKTGNIIMPNNPVRIDKARKNGKLVLPCDPVEEVEHVVEEVVELPHVEVKRSTFTHIKLQKGQFYQIGDYLFEAV